MSKIHIEEIIISKQWNKITATNQYYESPRKLHFPGNIVLLIYNYKQRCA